ncbi:MAG: hypothetical protein A3F43_01810 [Gammaproteobacteria bacterium RIFCSPHIGHO2_12_FULL_42_10]|nr:MAG: hypothetical protein A3F43_01810 [Gammaproteobacteria bacterium RIFCSPHIGHO2_12_FULL_42_10]
MTDTATFITTLETSLTNLAKQAAQLAHGLQNIAPATKTEQGNLSIHYLSTSATSLNEYAAQCQQLLTKRTAEHFQGLHVIIDGVIARDQALRTEHQIADKFRFIQDCLQRAQKDITTLVDPNAKQTKQAEKPTEDEVPVYVYLFNAQGVQLDTWIKMLSPGTFYDHSINRPIYQEAAHIEGFIKRKSDPMQHAYLIIRVNKKDIIETNVRKDAYDYPLIRVKEGSLLFRKRVSLTHHGHTYLIGDAGELKEKT